MRERPVLVGVGMGPGDPELVTLKAVRELRDADLVLVPATDTDRTGRAERTVRAHARHDRIRRVLFALGDHGLTDRRVSAWEEAGRAVLEAVDAGARRVAFATIGDPAIYSTFSYLAQTVRSRRPDVTVRLVPGVTALQDLAARSGTVLVEGSETLELVPVTAGIGPFEQALSRGGTVVAYKGGRRLAELLAAVRAAGRAGTAVLGCALGLPEERIARLPELYARPPGTGETDSVPPAPYLSTLVVPAVRAARGGKL